MFEVKNEKKKVSKGKKIEKQAVNYNQVDDETKELCLICLFPYYDNII